MQIDTIKALFTYITALVIIAGGLVFLFATRLDPPGSVAGLQTVISGFIGSALTFVFTRESATQATKAATAATLAANGNGKA